MKKILIRTLEEWLFMSGLFFEMLFFPKSTIRRFSSFDDSEDENDYLLLDRIIKAFPVCLLPLLAIWIVLMQSSIFFQRPYRTDDLLDLSSVLLIFFFIPLIFLLPTRNQIEENIRLKKENLERKAREQEAMDRFPFEATQKVVLLQRIVHAKEVQEARTRLKQKIAEEEGESRRVLSFPTDELNQLLVRATETATLMIFGEYTDEQIRVAIKRQEDILVELNRRHRQSMLARQVIGSYVKEM